MQNHKQSLSVGTVAELFAGVGGFRLGLEASGWETVYSNQWEPSTKRQHASEVYVRNFGSDGHSNQDIALIESLSTDIDLLVGGFPCQDYSVAKSRSSATGIQGKKGVLWWEILRLVRIHKPKFLFLENVDRLLKSPSGQRGRDFAIMLSTLGSEGYVVEWRVVNAADYGFPQRRRRVFLVAYKENRGRAEDIVSEDGVLAKALPHRLGNDGLVGYIDENLIELSEGFGIGAKKSIFQSSGFYEDGVFTTFDSDPTWQGPYMALGDVLLSEEDIPANYYLDVSSLAKWSYLKGAKSEERVHRTGYKWRYSEGSMVFPDPINKPSRTILTGEGGTSPSRFKHVVSQNNRLRRLHPIELERLNGFPDDWTRFGQTEMSDVRRSFFMGNALVVGLIERVGIELANRMGRK